MEPDIYQINEYLEVDNSHIDPDQRYLDDMDNNDGQPKLMLREWQQDYCEPCFKHSSQTPMPYFRLCKKDAWNATHWYSGSRCQNMLNRKWITLFATPLFTRKGFTGDSRTIDPVTTIHTFSHNHFVSAGSAAALAVEVQPSPPPQIVESPEVLPVTCRIPDVVVTIEVVSQLIGVALHEAMPRQASNQLVNHMSDHMCNFIKTVPNQMGLIEKLKKTQADMDFKRNCKM